MTLKGHDGKYKDIDGAAGILDVAGMMDAACVLRPVSVGAGIEEDDWGEAGVVVDGAGGAGESAMGERVLDSAGGV
jgi:hypothetical protein